MRPDALQRSIMAIQLFTFGGLHAEGDNGELERLLAQHSRAALFIYLAVERRVSRDSLIALFWPESDAENARHALRQSLYHLRKAVGEQWIDSRAHELVVSDDVHTDAYAFALALDRGDNESAVRVYRGPFLDGVHLVDLKPWESWVDSRRAQYARTFRKACRDLIDARHAAGDFRGAIEAAELWTSRDASDDEAQHRLIEALAAAGERAEAIRQYETYARMLEPEGLTPLDETEQLVERLRSDATPLPLMKVSTDQVRRSPPIPEPMAEQDPIITRRRHHRLWFLSAAATLTVLFAFAWALRLRQTASSAAASAPVIAVFPFSVRGGETVRYLSEGIVNLLGTALEGSGSLRPVDTRATFAAVAEASGTVPDPERGSRVAARLGAGKFVLGDVVEAGGLLHIEAAVYDAGDCARSFRLPVVTANCAKLTPITKAVVSGAADSVFDLVDRLAAQLLGGLGDPSADRLVRTAAVTTTSLPAFKAYLQGEAMMRAGQFEKAADTYLSAIALDSTFAVAHYKLALAREWAPLPGEEAAASAASRHAGRLSTRDRNLLDAFRQWRAGDATEADHAYRAILSRYPDDVDAWFQLGEIQFHHGPLEGHSLGESEEAWRKVLSYEPRNLFALTHLARIASVTGRARSLDSLLSQFDSETLRKDRRLEELVILRAVAKRDTGAARALAQNVRAGESFSIWRVAVFLTAFGPDPITMRPVIQELIKDYPNPDLRADLHWFASLLDLAAGRVVAARASLTEAADAERAVPADRRRSAFQPTTEWFAATLPLPYADSTLIRMRRDAISARPLNASSRGAFESVLAIGLPIQFEPLRQYTLGNLSIRLGDTASAVIASARLAHFASSEEATTLVRDLDRGLRASIAFKRRHPDEALRLLEDIESRDSQGDIAATPFVSRANERFLHAEVLVALGRHDEALRWYASLGNGSVTEIPLQALSHFRQAEIHERLKRRDQAGLHYARFIELWRDVDPEFRPLVDKARLRLASLAPTG
jgi:DNA-binding SARP family transcriptional activator